MKELTIVPLSDRIVVERLKIKTLSGIILPDSTTEKSLQGQIVAVGPGKKVNGVLCPMSLNVGDVVLFNKFSGIEIVLNKRDLIVLREDDIIGIVF